MRKIKKKNIDFFLNNRHYRSLHIILYLISITIIILTYFLTILLFSKFVNMILTALISFIVGLYVVLNRDQIVKKLSNYFLDRKRKKIKIENQQNLRTTLKKITPKNNNLKLNITSKTPMQEKIKGIRIRFNKPGTKKKLKEKYIEINK